MHFVYPFSRVLHSMVGEKLLPPPSASIERVYSEGIRISRLMLPFSVAFSNGFNLIAGALISRLFAAIVIVVVPHSSGVPSKDSVSPLYARISSV